jgi:hypothetical protein
MQMPDHVRIHEPDDLADDAGLSNEQPFEAGLTNEQLFEMYLYGCKDSLAALYERYREQLGSRLRRRFGVGETSVDELMQDVWLDVEKHHERLERLKASLRRSLGMPAVDKAMRRVA